MTSRGRRLEAVGRRASRISPASGVGRVIIMRINAVAAQLRRSPGAGGALFGGRVLCAFAYWQGARDRQLCIDGAAFVGHLPSDIGTLALQLLHSNEALPRLLREPSGLSIDGVETVAQTMAR
jgi:hypothetical protein